MYVMRDFQSLVDVGNSESGGGQQPFLASTNSFRRSLRRANSVHSNRKWVVVSFALPHLQSGVAEKLKRCWDLSEFRHFIVPVSVVGDKKKTVQKLASSMIGRGRVCGSKKISAERKAKTLARTAASCGNLPVAARLTDPAIAGFCEMNTTGIRLASILVAEGAKLASSLVAKKLILANLSSLKSRGSSFARTKRASVGAVLKHLVIRRAADRWKDLRAFAMALVLRTVSQTEHPEEMETLEGQSQKFDVGNCSLHTELS
ncbi:hypothetical protein DAPPUDRAFT_113022 [Daphnia pulex]|uniref:Uncharacterized protein n=1 Tax=Daphnia pulex TaxID=6669 RepID=E9HDU5_DAPPU|nr:hypothetical protein DAPPUDRAFT_113022 [Daphnia pulex]|eukprot:EFX70111.1 hypothetical protein DAPPUDRAFT_113022 [Daphnia pulex]